MRNKAGACFVSQVEVKQHDIHRRSRKHVHRLGRCSTLSDGLKIRLGDEEAAQAFPEQHVIIKQ